MKGFANYDTELFEKLHSDIGKIVIDFHMENKAKENVGFEITVLIILEALFASIASTILISANCYIDRKYIKELLEPHYKTCLDVIDEALKIKLEPNEEKKYKNH